MLRQVRLAPVETILTTAPTLVLRFILIPTEGRSLFPDRCLRGAYRVRCPQHSGPDGAAPGRVPRVVLPLPGPTRHWCWSWALGGLRRSTQIPVLAKGKVGEFLRAKAFQC